MRSAPANQKLPILYLIDSIIKNVGGPYVNLFGRSIVNLFLEAYTVVDSAAKTSFEKVLGTWPNWNTQLFPRETIASIEREVQLMRQQRQAQYQQSSMHVNPHFSERLRENPYNQGQGPVYGSNGAGPAAPQNRNSNAQTQAQASIPAQNPSSGDSRSDNVLLQDIQLLKLQKQQAIILNQNDQASIKQVDILQQLETIVKTTQLTPENANMIRQQLAQLWTPAQAPPVVSGYPQANISQSLSMASSSMPPNMMVPPPRQIPIHPPNAHHQPATTSSFPNVPPALFPPHLPPPGLVPGSQPIMVGSLPTSVPIPGAVPLSGAGAMPVPLPMAMPPLPPAASPVPPTSAPSAPIAPAPSDLFASLLQSGLLGPNGTLTNQLLQNTANANRAPQSPLIATAAAASATPPMPPSNLNDRVNQNELDQGVMSLGLIELTGQDIQKYARFLNSTVKVYNVVDVSHSKFTMFRRRPAAIQVMYGTPPLQCNQCGYRCPKSADAQKKMDAHLDWHFRQNRRMKDKAKKSHSRSWLVGEEDWIHSRESDPSQNQQPVFFDFGSGVSKTSKDELALQEEIATLKEQVISEPSLIDSLRGNDPTITVTMAMNIISKGCSICKEKFIKIWNDAEDEWSYKNAIVIDKLIYHATCNADLIRSNQRQAALAEAATAAAAVIAATAAAANATPPQSSNSQMSDSSDATGISLDQVKEAKDLVKSDIKMDINLEQNDHEMSGPDSNVPLSLKRKIEADQLEQEQLSSKKTILANDS
ncbi:hypothetical protein BGZ46_004444 [Entomortierella lignicola]|nr:hypothetical protein BGZ46_004444 [Entomortierella lignicola]